MHGALSLVAIRKITDETDRACRRQLGMIYVDSYFAYTMNLHIHAIIMLLIYHRNFVGVCLCVY